MKTVSILAVLLLALSLSACNTTKGLGQDIEAAGGAIEDAAEKTKRKM